METRDVFEETGRIGREISRIKKKLGLLTEKYQSLTELCPHEVVLKYNDNHPRKMMIEGHYFCPACGKTITCNHKNQINETAYKNSRIIPLTISLLGTPENYRIIRNEVYENIDLYYNSQVSIEELSSKMEDLLREKNCEYKYESNVYKMVRKRGQ